ncbi:hypothetical protein L249_1412 [Ophiocordyceps polyrhachis-furcata BCC 54312]|uniref:N-acetyltransferase ESCO zinc-finger domain-containing protein n=1 Tax=Ophiocordyceps polyrhachis-furcata BCC 54312 TaxID=1330021 RepID=A0A367L4I5_9HYPO|nr:hypothetical protein L249_1412 [Ophiocordyceps polyrhachis-furcata BCC 54312]
MTPLMVESLNSVDSSDEAAIGQPISHGEVVDLWTRLRPSCSLEKLLQGSRVYAEPPAPKPEPSDEYKALMARLRHEEAARTYQRMVDAPRFQPTTTTAQNFAAVNRPSGAAEKDDEVTYGEVQRQVMLIINFLVSILGVAGTLWAAARWWSLPARLLLTLSGAIVVAVAETAVYRAYVWRMGRARAKQKALPETKKVVNTWVVGKDADAPVQLLKTSRDSPDDAEVGNMSTEKRQRKPLRTYGKRPASTTPNDEPRAKKLLLARPSSPRLEKVRPSLSLQEESVKRDDVAEEESSSVEEEGKTSIRSYFKPVVAQAAGEKPERTSDSKSGSVDEASPSRRRMVRRSIRRPRLLRLRNHTPDEARGDYRASNPTMHDEHAALPGANEGSKDWRGEKPEVQSIRQRRGRRKKPTPVQTTLNLSSTQGAFAECKACDMVWNPLYPADVSYHSKLHARMTATTRPRRTMHTL